MADDDQFSTPIPQTAHKHRHLHLGTESRGTDLLTKTPAAGIVTKVTFNDDEAERRQRRLNSNLCTMMSPGCHTPKSAAHSSTKRGQVAVESVTSSLTNTQLKDHYANCIKLSSQNKINAKNAFGLHLIDHMLQLLTIRGEMTNFQVASSTLDASAKIYAGRVDSIYTDAFKVLTGFGREAQSQGTDKSGENTTESGTSADGAKRTGKTKKANPSMIEKNLKNLTVNTFDCEYEVDPLFKKTSAAFDEGGVGGLLINHLHTGGQSYVLSFNPDEVPSYKDEPGTHTEVDVRDLRKLISTSMVRSRQFCPTVVSLFEEEDGEKDSEDEQTEKSTNRTAQKSDIGAEYSMLPCPPGGEDFPGHDDGLDDVGPVGGTEVTFAEDADSTVLGSCSDNKRAGFIPNAPAIPTGDQAEATGDGFLGPLCLSDAIQTSDYSYFAPSVLATWAGPRHWKIHPKSADIVGDEKRKSKRKRQPPAQFTIDFNQTPDKTAFTKGKAAVKLSKQVLTRRSSARITLPEDPHTKADVLHKLFSRPKWEVRRRRGKVQPMDDRLEGDWYDYGNPHDNANYCPQVQDDSDGEGDAGGVEVFPLSQGDVTETDQYSQTQDVGNNTQTASADAEFALTGDNLIPQPRKVQKIHIEYARTAKRLDIKKLKHRMWEILTPDDDTKDETSTDSAECQDTVASKVSNFSTLCSNIPSQLSNEMRRNISVPICFVCLLHLANEKELDIKGSTSLSDLEIVAKQIN